MPAAPICVASCQSTAIGFLKVTPLNIARTEAPDFFARDGDNGTSYLMKQPVTAEEIAVVESAAANCATGSIGDETAG